MAVTYSIPDSEYTTSNFVTQGFPSTRQNPVFIFITLDDPRQLSQSGLSIKEISPGREEAPQMLG